MRKGFISLLAALALAVTATLPAHAAEEIWALTSTNQLMNFISSNPGAFSQRPISGMSAGEFAIGIDFRPAAPLGRMYALSNLGRLYLIADPTTGAAAPVGAGGIALSGSDFGFDFNPTVDRIRVISNTGQSLRLHPDLGTLVATDTPLAYAAGDPGFGVAPQATGAAYSNNVPGALTTTLYDIDTGRDVLVTQNPANAGTLGTVGPLGLNAVAVNGFDISGQSGVAYAALSTDGLLSVLYSINLSTGAATSMGWIPCNEAVRGLSVSPLAPTPTQTSSWGRIKSLYR